MDDNTNQVQPLPPSSLNDLFLDLANQAEDAAIQQEQFNQKYEEYLDQIQREDNDFNGTSEE